MSLNAKKLSSHEGYLLNDNSATLGMGGRVEFATLTCSHCQTIMVKNPLRTRERTFCKGCNHYICDSCSAIMQQTHKCKTFKQLIDEVQEAEVRNIQRSLILV